MLPPLASTSTGNSAISPSPASARSCRRVTGNRHSTGGATEGVSNWGTSSVEAGSRAGARGSALISRTLQCLAFLMRGEQPLRPHEQEDHDHQGRDRVVQLVPRRRREYPEVLG